RSSNAFLLVRLLMSTRIEKYRPTNCRLRMHLGLVIPKVGCRIRCPQCRFWEEGKVVIFDDSFEHEVWQDAQSYRLIFIVDVWHPELTPQQRLTLPAI
uniref:Aspartyl/asparaginy/proline hydroxylase domain-containing protein n=1 Tax=Anolis carolinensis TaxID=28377 RepID=A0A803TMV8_ANOCA